MTRVKKVLITGATSGIGKSLCQRYLHEGYHVIACGRNTDKLTQLSQQFSQQHSQLTVLTFDVNNNDEVANAATKIAELDLLILNAGDCAYIDDVRQFNGQVFSDIIHTNLISLGWLLQYFLPKVNTNGQLVFISSSATLLPFSRAQAYGASKAGVDYLANSLRVDLKPHLIDVTLVHPGFIKTPLTEKNDFHMPCIISSEQAAQAIFSGVNARKKYLHFPKKFTYFLKLMAILPTFVWQSLHQRSTQ
ncbi:SDR family NAD(P)-dependent oxidoreductase [Thalassotalea sp. PLHSN55]|uniref:SDR family NAD(P)-dependent oxidoreductase n=1 Tax=Thalassotalea sp. PLHSN55 TaxID=3435888 RepID=UPI003F84E24D